MTEVVRQMQSEIFGVALAVAVFVVIVLFLNNAGAASNAAFTFNPRKAVDTLAFIFAWGHGFPMPRVLGAIAIMTPSVICFFVGRALGRRFHKRQ